MTEIIDEQANEIADKLFVNGVNQKADRLVLDLGNGRDGGGWCKQAVVDVIKSVLNKRDIVEDKSDD